MLGVFMHRYRLAMHYSLPVTTMTHQIKARVQQPLHPSSVEQDGLQSELAERRDLRTTRGLGRRLDGPFRVEAGLLNVRILRRT
jgi:hypothetical protein